MRHQAGFFINHILLMSLALLGVILMAANYMLENNQRGRSIAEDAAKARDQMQMIRDALTVCRVTWPGGNNGTGNHVNYPATPGVDAWGPVANLVCPGANNGAGQGLWAAVSYTLGQYPNHVDVWQYQNTASGVFIKLTSQDQDGNFILKQVAQRLSSTEKTLDEVSSPNTLVVQLLN